MASSLPPEFQSLIHDVPDFPKPGIMFRDITPLLAHPQGLSQVSQSFATAIEAANLAVDVIVGVESRGFLLGTPLAMHLGCGFVPVRKVGKLPRATFQAEYALEYGTDRLEIHQDAIQAGQKVLVVDDVIATGGTANATASLVNQAGGNLLGFAFLIELSFLAGRANLPQGISVISLITY
ncbi:MAG: adenine phosphoribosyltransferase [Pseudanabaena sp. ELA607]|jgi:adenine phosphoribosyltransferase